METKVFDNNKPTTNKQGDFSYFTSNLKDSDSEVYNYLHDEWQRQNNSIELIASENIVSKAVLSAIGSVCNNKYAEGYPGKRYYGGCKHIDKIEQLAIDRACKLFNCKYANVQPHSGSQANQAVFMATMKPGDTFLGMDLRHGGHLTHGAKPNISGKWFVPKFYGLNTKTGLLDYDEIKKQAISSQAKVIIAGASAYSRILDFAKFREIADSIGAVLMVDMAHIAGLVAGGVHPSPFPYADVVTSTTHKTLRCARGGLILTNDEAMAKKINSAIFPGLQGGPLEQQIAGKAVGLGEALKPSFKVYAQSIVDNASQLAKTLIQGGLSVVSGGTDNHLMLIDLQKLKITGKQAEQALESVGIICNKNGIPDDPQSPRITSGIRLGTSAMTTRGFAKPEFTIVAELILETLNHISSRNELSETTQSEIAGKVSKLAKLFPIYPILP